MIIDLNSFIGTWPSHPVEGQPDVVWTQLRALGVTRIYASSLASVWCRNPHVYNEPLYEAASQTEDVWPVPVLDPSVSTWKRELDRALAQDRVQLVRLLPNYHQYDLNDIGDILEALVDAKLGAIVQVCMEDIRRQHPLSQVPNVSVSDVFDVAERFSKLRLIIGGAKAGEIRGAKARLLSLPNLYADVSQVDGLNAIRVLVDEGLEAKLVFGSHAPLFIPYAALGRVVTDLDDEATEAILNGNALRFLSGG